MRVQTKVLIWRPPRTAVVLQRAGSVASELEVGLGDGVGAYTVDANEAKRAVARNGDQRVGAGIGDHNVGGEVRCRDTKAADVDMVLYTTALAGIESVNHVIAEIGIEHNAVVTQTDVDGVVTRATIQVVVAQTAIDPVIARTTIDIVVAASTIEEVCAASTQDGIVAAQTIDGIGAAVSGDHVGALTAQDIFKVHHCVDAGLCARSRASSEVDVGRGRRLRKIVGVVARAAVVDVTAIIDGCKEVIVASATCHIIGARSAD
jgi:hypothetical protein